MAQSVGGRIDSGFAPVFDVELQPAIAARQARFMVHDALVDQVSGPFLSDAVLATSELVTNAEQYAPGAIRLTMHRQPGSRRIRIGVADTSPELPLQDRTGAMLDPSSGRGLRIVDMIASEWGVTPVERGKQVWFEMVRGHHS
ncbi:MAG: ATP-binding protein [Ilumatobacteraceae bacterium]